MAGQGQQLAVVVDAEALQVHLEGAVAGRSCGGGRGRLAGGHTFEDGADPGGHFARAEGLDHVVVGADLQAHHAVDLGIAGGEEDHRHFGEAP